MVPLFHFIKQKLERSDNWRSLQSTLISLWGRVQATRLITYGDASAKSHPDPVGLINISNTCYLNATLQALASCDNFIIYLENIIFVGKQLSIRPRLSSLLLHCLLILRGRKSAYIDGDYGNYNCKNPFNPKSILHEILRHDKTFVIGVQHDADELMRKLLEVLSEEEKQVKQHLVSKEVILNDLQYSNRPNLSVYSRVDSSIPICIEKGDNNPFLGLFCKQLECCQCHHSKQVNHELFTILPLIIPNQNPAGICTLDDCLDYFIAPEIISDVICNSCSALETIKHLQNNIKRYEPLREKRSEYNQEFLNNKMMLDNVTSNYTKGESDVHLVDLDELEQLQNNRHYVREKRMDVRKHNILSRLPGTICISIGRKSYNEHGLQVKLNQHIFFTETIDIRKYFTTYGNNGDITALLYGLVSIVVHHGSAQGGHYTNYSLINGKWFHFSDASVHEVKKEEALRAQAYMLFYKKKSE